MLKANGTLKAITIVSALFAMQISAAKGIYGSYCSKKNNVMYAPGDYLAFESPIITASGISTDKKGTIFTISKPGIYQVSFSVRAKSEASTKATSVALELDNAVIEETQTTSTTAEISNAIGIYLIDVKKAGSVLSIKNVSKGKVHILDGLDLILNINKIS